MRLIDADWLEGRFGKRICADWADERYRGAMQDALCEVLGAPNIDAVPVVRCGECKWVDVCKVNGHYNGKNGFCSRGVREEKDNASDPA